MLFWTWRIVAAIVRLLPLRVSYAIADLAGALAFLTWRRGRRATIANFRVVLGAGTDLSRVKRVARRSLQNYCRYLVDFARFPAMGAADVCNVVRGEEHFQELRARLEYSGGIVATCMHFGNWDLGAAATGARGIPATAVAESFGNPGLDELVFGARRKAGLDIVLLGSGAPSMFRALKNGRVLAVVVDRPTPGDGVEVSFFGRSTWVPGGAARLALRAGVPVCAAAFPRAGRNRPDVAVWTDFDIPLPPPESPDRVRELTQAIFRAHEAFIRRQPTQWYMFREMWPGQDTKPQ